MQSGAKHLARAVRLVILRQHARCFALLCMTAFLYYEGASYQTAQKSNSRPTTMQQKQLKLRPTEKSDLEFFFQFQLDEEAGYLAAFMPENHTDKEAYVEKQTRFLNDPTIHTQTILVDETIAGSIGKFERDGDAEITCWIDRNFWGKGVATTALKNFLTMESARPIFGRVAFDNLGSQRVLERCGFVKIGTDKGFANARQTEVEEFIYKLT